MDNATGMATKYLLEMLNIGGKRDEPRESESEKQKDKKDGEESVSMSVTSSTASASQQMKSMSDMSLSVGEIPGFLDGSTPRISLHPINQKIHLTSNDEDNGVSVFGNHVEVVTSQNTSSSSSITASNKIKINQMVKYDWDLKFYRGNLIALGNPFIAYTLKGRNGYVIRLLNPETASRALIKGFTGLVSDLAFAHHNSKTLACVDEGGNIFVWNISEEDNKIEYKVKLHISRSSSVMSEYHRVFWCPYLPDDEDEEEEGGKKGFDDLDDRSLAVTHDNKAEVIDIAMVVARCDCSEVTLEMLKQGEGYVSIIDGHTKPITDGSLSPDNAVLATASEDGYVRFWQISDMMPDGEHNCLHEFQPHGGAPLSSLVFCDNHLVHEKDVPMWRFMITGAEYNREIKIWCTVEWTCLQTLRFTSPTTDIESVLGGSYFKIQLDLTARYLVLSDIGRRVLYVLLVHQNRAEGKAHVTSISDFQLTQPLLSFVITKAKLFRLKSFDHEVQENGDGGVSNDVYDAESPDELEESELDSLEKRKNLMVQLRMYSIHTKTLQELLVHFQPEPSVAPCTPSIMSSLNTSIGQGVRDALSDLSGNMDTGTETSTDIDESDEASSEKSAPLQPKLISPEAFTHLSKDSSRPDSSASNVSSATLVSALNLSHNSVEDSVTSSVTSKASESTARSSVQDEIPHTFYGQHPGILTPTSLPLPGTPPFSVAPDPTAVPIPMFTTSPRTSTSDELLRQSPKGDVGRMNASPVQELRLTQEKKEIEEAEPEEDQERATTPVTEVNKDDSQQSLASIPKEPIAVKDVSNSESSDEPFAEDTSHKERNSGGNTVAEMDSMNFTWMTATDRHSPHNETPVKYKRRTLEAGLASTPVSRVDIPPESSRQLVDQNIFSSLNELVHLVKSQQQQITSLRQELNDHQAKEHQSLSDLIQGQVAQLEDTMLDRINGGLAQRSMEENQRLEKSIKDRHTQDKKKHEQLLSTLSQAVTNSITGKLDKTLKQEMKNNLIPTIQKAIIPIQEQLNTTMAQKLTAADTVLKDSAYKIVKNKGVIDAIGNSAANALQGPIQATYREAFQNTILPAFERACQSMFQQINDAFQKGTHQYLEKVTLSLESQGKKDTRDIDQVMSQVQLLRAETQRHSSSLINDVEGVLQKQLATALHSLREEMLTRFESQVKNSVQEIVKSEVKEALREVRQTYSEAPVPETVPQQPTVDTKTQIIELIQSGNFSQAFQEALTAADLSLVVFVCDSIDSNELFSQSSSPLSQPVLLSLIQQLSVDLLTQTELKHRYLMEAVMSLDTANEVTREHMPAVLQGLFQQLGYAISECTGATQKSLKVLQMAAQSLLR